MGVSPASSGGGQLARLSGGYQSPAESSLRQDAGDAQRKAPVAPRIPASSLPEADLNWEFTMLLEMKNIDKAFNGVPVLKKVQLQVEKGEVHALLGENGAGKSTLMNVLTGVYTRDGGTVEFDGKTLEHITIKGSEEMGIAFVHQELNLFNDMTVWENIFLGKEITGPLGRCNKKEMIRMAGELFSRLDVSIDPTEKVENLKTSEKQLLEISKALFFQAKLLILDEPTTALNNDEIDHLFQIIRNLKKEGTSFIFISHKMPEIFAISDRYTVFRNGEYIASGQISEITAEEITRLMVGNTASFQDIYETRDTGDVVLSLSNYSGPGFEDISLDVRRGQIVGLTGLQGAGSSELMQSIFGITHATGGSVKVNGEIIPAHSTHRAMRAGVAMLASNRKENSVIPDMSLLENMYLAEHTLSAGKFHINRGQEKEKYENYRRMLNIKAQDSSDSILSLSGGNQQKVFLARWLNTNADVLLLDNPTQGIDVGAKAEIYKLILQLAKEGKTILINTLEIPEIQKIADYCAVFYEGRIVKILQHQEINEQTVMLYSTNAANA